VKIIKHAKFKCDDAPNNIASLKRYSNGLPLLPIKSHSVGIDSKQTPSTAKPLKDAYYFSVLDHIKMVLKNPSLKNEMYFGPGIETTNKTEFWHGTLWQESPLFECEKILLHNSKNIIFIIANNELFNNLLLLSAIYFSGEFVHYSINSIVKPGRIIALVKDENGDIKVKIQQLLQNDELPRNFQSVRHNSMQLWMTNNVFVITLSQIISKVSVWFEDTEEPFFYEYKINNILYSFNNHYKLRPISFHHHHPSEYIKLHSTPPEVQVLKIFVDLYYDDFGTFRTSYHSLGGLYIQFGNMPLKLRQN